MKKKREKKIRIRWTIRTKLHVNGLGLTVTWSTYSTLGFLVRRLSNNLNQSATALFLFLIFCTENGSTTVLVLHVLRYAIHIMASKQMQLFRWHYFKQKKMWFSSVPCFSIDETVIFRSNMNINVNRGTARERNRKVKKNIIWLQRSAIGRLAGTKSKNQ